MRNPLIADMLAVMDDTRPFHHSDHTIEASPDQVWEVLTDAEGVDAWFGPGSHLEAEEGGELDVNDETTGTRRAGIVHRVEPGRRLAFTWWPEPDDAGHPTTTHVDITLVPSGAGCRVVVTERPAFGSISTRSTTTASAHLATRASWRTRIRALARCTILAGLRQG